MKDLIEVFRMNEIDVKTRARLLFKLGSAINAEYAMNITEPLVFELVSILDPENDKLKEPLFRQLADIEAPHGK